MSGGLPLGKLPPALLARLLGRIPAPDPRVIVPARPGVDAAVLDLGDRLLIATSDPITFPTPALGWYAVHVNANDIAVMGGEPRWFLATLLLPRGTDEAAVERIFRDLIDACDSLGVALIGGHTEVSHGLDRPILAGTMLGEASPGGVITSAAARPGDRVIVTGGFAIEGTSILATEARETLLSDGVGEEELARGAALLRDPGISVVAAARALRVAVRPRAMHDATEGGVATALCELAEASGVGLRIDGARLPVLPETRRFCAALGLDPLGLLASGCLLAVVAPEDEAAGLASLRAAGVAGWSAGEVVAGGALTIVADGVERSMPSFRRDELARWLERPT